MFEITLGNITQVIIIQNKGGISFKNLKIFQFKTLQFIKAVSDPLFDMINDAYYDKPLIFIGGSFREKLVTHHQAVNIYTNCWLDASEFIKVVSDTLFEMIHALYYDKPLIFIGGTNQDSRPSKQDPLKDTVSQNRSFKRHNF